MRKGAPLLVALAVVSSAALAWQIALIHLLSIAHWGHFASLVVSLALLGFGASGSAVAVARRAVEGCEVPAFAITAGATALTLDPVWRIAAAIPFDAFELLAVPRQFLWLSLFYLVLSIPFLLAGACVALAFLAMRDSIGRVYAANLSGSGVGAFVGLGLVATLPAEWLPLAVAGIASLALLPLVPRAGAVVVAFVAGMSLLLPPTDVPVSSYKEGRQALRHPEARLLAREAGALGRLDLVAAPSLRYLPGASLALKEPVPSRPVFYLNGQPLGPRTVAADTSLLSLTTEAAAFALPSAGPPSVLVLGMGGGAPIWLARAHGADSIVAADPDERLDALLAPGTLGSDVHRVTTGLRGALRGPAGAWDRILVTEVGSLVAGASGMGAAGTGWLFTTDAVTDVWRALAPGGVATWHRWMLEPPRDVLRLLSTIEAVLEAEGVARPADHVAVVRGWGTVAVLLSRDPLDPTAVAALREWSVDRQFDLAWAPGVSAEEARRFHRVDPDWIHRGAKATLGVDAEALPAAYPFLLEPATDDAPFFFHFLPFGELVGLWGEGGRLSLPFFEWGVIAHALALVQAIPLAAILILLPLLALRGRHGRGERRPDADGSSESRGRAGPAPGGTGSLFAYFALLGLGFMLLEISSIQRLVLWLAEPVVSATVVIATFLVFAGLGSQVADTVTSRFGSRAPFVGIAVIAPAVYGASLLLWEHAAGLPLAGRMLLAVALLAPLAFLLGIPFPTGLQRVADRRPGWIPWCWGVNGFLSVVGAAATPLIALKAGFDGTLLIAIGLYAAAALLLPRLGRRPGAPGEEVADRGR
ncbi:MAG: hypothetical protein R3326_00275 [Gemmatimonadota bacterium]|nr:hypothetical protein [Gemmatimonadota bacterium]